MNVKPITMPRELAQEKLAAYRQQLTRRNDEEYEAAAAGYAALAEGTPLISVTEAIRGGGFDEQKRPKLAIARADRKQVHFQWRPGSPWATFDTRKGSRESNSLLCEIDMGRTHGVLNGNPPNQYGAFLEGFALVPMIPADVRSTVNVDLADCFILWEVEQWADRPLRSVPDRDPFLLKHLGGDLYAVLAEWNLTELEQLVMTGRRDG
jgi:hypothetical protein